MSVHVGEAISDVEVLPEAREERREHSEGPQRDARARLRALMESVKRDAARTRSRGYDD